MKTSRLFGIILKWSLKVTLYIIVLFFVLATMVYFPPVQHWAKNRICSYLSNETGMDVSIRKLRLAFPLDLMVSDMCAQEGGDTIVSAQQLYLDIRMLPLLKGNIELNGFELRRAQINSQSYISDTHIEGRFKLLAIDRPAICDLTNKKVDMNRLRFKDSDIRIILSDTAAIDTTSSPPIEWVIALNQLNISNSHIYVQMPGDSMRISSNVATLNLQKANIDLSLSIYSSAFMELAATNTTYDIPYQQTAKGFDTNHLHFPLLNARLKDFRYDSSGINLALNHLMLKEKSGISLDDLSANIHYDSTRIEIGNGILTTPHSKLKVEASVPFSIVEKDDNKHIKVNVNGEIGKNDLVLFAGDAISDYAKDIPNKPIAINIGVEGSSQKINIDYCRLTMPNNMEVRISGQGRDIMNPHKRSANLHYTVAMQNTSVIRQFIPKDIQHTVHIPNGVRLGGDIAFKGNNVHINRNTLYYGGGSVSFTGTFSPSNMAYSGTIVSQNFPLQSFLPTMNLSPLTAKLEVKGRGTDFMQKGTTLTTKAQIHSLYYSHIPLSNLQLEATLNGNSANGALVSDNSWLKANLMFTALQKGDELTATLTGDISDLNIEIGKNQQGNNSSTANAHIMMNLDIMGFYNDRKQAMACNGQIKHLNVATSSMGYPCGDINFNVGTGPDSTHLYLNAGDLTASAHSSTSLTKLLSQLEDFSTQFTRQLLAAQLNQDTIKSLLPELKMRLHAGKANPVQKLLTYQGYAFDSISTQISSSKQQGINADIEVTNFKNGSALFEHSQIIVTHSDSGIKLNASIQNTGKKNPNRFSGTIDGEMYSDGFSVLARFLDSRGREGLNIGTRATFDGYGGISFSLIPEISTLAYRKFKVNKDNYLLLDSKGFFTANIDLMADDKTRIMLFSVKNDSINQDITLSLANLSLSDLSSVVPYFPPVKGFVNGDIHVQRTEKTFTVVGQLETNKLEYNGMMIGNIGTELFYMPEDSGQYVMAQILSGDRQVAVLDGHYYDHGNGILDASINLDRFPASLLNGFVSEDGTFALSGQANGEIRVKGPTDKLVFNGALHSDSIHVYSELYGFDLRMEDRDIQIINSKANFNNVRFYSVNENPLHVNGDIDFTDPDKMVMDFSIKANDFQLISASKTRKNVLYGSMLVDLDATLKGKSGLSVLRGKLDVLGQTNVTYIMRDTPLQVEDQFSGLVEFVDFSIHEEQQQSEPPASGLFVSMAISINEQSHLHCEMSDDGKSYIDCNGGGDLSFRMFPSGDMTMNGRFNITGGEMKYTLPFIPLKTFKFTEGNYVLFNGDIYNPTLNIKAVETTKAAVNNDNGSSRMVLFDVGVAITRQVSNMGIDFLINAPEDTEVQSELATMSHENRSRLAVSMLVTGLYLSPGNKTGFKANNALNAFLESEIRNIAGNALKTIDISVGVEGNTTYTGETQTDYTFEFSKKLWNDRVTFVIGGKVTTGATDNASSSQSFIDNISLEYRINKIGTHYIQIFYNNKTRDPLEGNLASAGVGYILRRKVDKLGELLILRRNKKEQHDN